MLLAAEPSLQLPFVSVLVLSFLICFVKYFYHNNKKRKQHSQDNSSVMLWVSGDRADWATLPPLFTSAVNFSSWRSRRSLVAN